jgi:transmembrane sensor
VKPWFDKDIAGRSASRWFARLLSDDISDATDKAFRRWLDRSPRNEQELERRELLWELLGELQNDPEMAAWIQSTAPPIRVPNRSRVRRRWSLAAAAATAAAILGIGYWQVKAPVRQAALAPEKIFTTKTGEQKRIVLSDGSQVELNTATRLRVRFTNNARLLNIDQGEAVFFVRHDANRPFEVVAGDTNTRALGTTFNILYLNNQADIAVLDGHIQVETASGSAAWRRIRLSAGQETTYTKQHGLGAIEPADLARIASWQAQRVEFQDKTLANAVCDFNRYSTTQMVIGDPSIEDIRVSGVFHFDDVTAFAEALHGTFGIRNRIEGQAVVLMAPSPAPRRTL